MDNSYPAVCEQLRRSYDGAVDERRLREVASWKATERESFLELLRQEGRRSMVDIGAGTGVHGVFFAQRGLDVLCVDLSPAMVRYCRAQGLAAECRDVLHLDLGRCFDAAFAMNCLLHVPPEVFPGVLESIATTLVPGGLFYLGQYGGRPHTGPLPEDTYEPKRYFSWLSDDQMLAAVSQCFEVASFRTIDAMRDADAHFQALVLRAPTTRTRDRRAAAGTALNGPRLRPHERSGARHIW